jgi:hypothetical protein
MSRENVALHVFVSSTRAQLAALEKLSPESLIEKNFKR